MREFWDASIIFVASLTSFIVHIDQHLFELVSQYGLWVYIILFIIVFCETGLVVTPILPGDSLLFAAGALSAKGLLNWLVLWFIIFVAAILGDWVNYHIGKHIGLKIFSPNARIFKSSYLEKTHAFYERYGGKTIIIARFVPIVRTFAPFVAGASRMDYRQFGFFNITGAFLWTTSMLGAGYLLAELPIINDHFSLIVLAIIAVSCLPMLFEWFRHYRRKRV